MSRIRSSLTQPPVKTARGFAASDRARRPLLVKVRTIAKLRRIERALQLIRTRGYGRCHRCQGDIPYEWLKVQPEA